MKTLVVGVGSPILGDDAVGVHAIRRLLESEESALPDGVEIAEIGTGGLALLEIVTGYDRLIVIDAMRSGAPPGTVRVLRGAEIGRGVHVGAGHETDLPTALTLGRDVLDEDMPFDVVVVAIEARKLTEFTEDLTPEVEAAIPEALAAVRRLIPEA